MTNKNLASLIDPLFNHQIKKISSLSGGDISSAFLVELTNYKKYFIKYNTKSIAMDLFEKERSGLQLICSSNSIAAPDAKAIKQSEHGSVLVLEYIEPKSPSKNDLIQFGKELASMHCFYSKSFGLEHDNYIGSLSQQNSLSSSWAQFYAKYRLQAQLILAHENKLLSQSEIPNFESIVETLESLIPTNDASLLHGDLWNGNYLISSEGKPYLIDPAVYFGDRLVDIAMTKLFGGFDEEFYESYFYWSGNTTNLEERIDIYQLYYLLVHLNLFGSSYYRPVKRIFARYF